MSRIAVISDIHGNLHALQAVLAEIALLGIRDVVCLGDVVGYGPQPGECLDIVLKRCIHTVLGNHDEAVYNHAVSSNFNPSAKLALQWTRQNLAEDHVEMLRLLPRVAYVDDSIICVHACPVEAATDYIHDARMAAKAFRGVDLPICLVGHTHVPIAFESPTRRAEENLSPREVASWPLADGQGISFRPGCRYILNPGSIGQPRDNDPRASFGILDYRRKLFSVHRVAYDVDAAQTAARCAGLPDILATRLAIGA